MDLKEKKLEELKKIAKKNKLVGYSKLNKSDLIKFIKKYIKSTKNKKVLTKKNKNKKSKNKKMIGGYVYDLHIMNSSVYIPQQPAEDERLPDNTFTIYTTGIANAYLKYIWSFILAPKLKAIIPETRPLRIIHSELCDYSTERRRNDFDRLRNYLTIMDNHVFGDRLIENGIIVTDHTLNFLRIQESGLNNHFILDFAHLFKYSINTQNLVYNRISDIEEDIPNTFSQSSDFRNRVYQGLINQIEINRLIENIDMNQRDETTYNTYKNNTVNIWQRAGFIEEANIFRTTRYSYTLNVITFLFVGNPLNNYDILRYNNLFRYEDGRIITYINDAIRDRKIFITNDPGKIFNSFNEHREIDEILFRRLSNYYNFAIDTENNIINRLLGPRNRETNGLIFTFNERSNFINIFNNIYRRNRHINEGRNIPIERRNLREMEERRNRRERINLRGRRNLIERIRREFEREMERNNLTEIEEQEIEERFRRRIQELIPNIQ